MEHFWSHRPILPDKFPELPISLKAMGNHHAVRGWEERNTGIHRPHCGLFWAFEGEADIAIGDRQHHLKAGNVISYYPFEGHWIRVTSSRFAYLWFTFDGFLAKEILQGYHFPDGALETGYPPESLLKEIYRSMHDYSLAARYRDSAYVCQLLALARIPRAVNMLSENEAGHGLIRKFTQIVDCEYRNPGLDLNVIARRLACHRTTITRLLKAEIGVTPTAYIMNVRLQNALQLLNETTLSVAEISERCGFSTANYFCRLVRQKIGVTPHRYRNEALASDLKGA